MKLRFNNQWVREIKERDFPYHFDLDILSVGRVDHQYYLGILNFVIILEV